MAEKRAVENKRISNFEGRDLDLGSGHTAYHHASLINLYLYAKLHGNWRHFLWTDRHTDRHTNRHLRLVLLDRLFKSRPKYLGTDRKDNSLQSILHVMKQTVHNMSQTN